MAKKEKRKKWKRTANDQENSNMFHCKELLEFRLLPSFQTA